MLRPVDWTKPNSSGKKVRDQLSCQPEVIAGLGTLAVNATKTNCLFPDTVKYPKQKPGEQEMVVGSGYQLANTGIASINKLTGTRSASTEIRSEKRMSKKQSPN